MTSRPVTPQPEAPPLPTPPLPDRPLRICLSPGGIGGGGIGMVMLHLAEALLAEGHAVDLLYLDEATDRAAPPGCSMVRIGRRARGALPGAVGYLRRARPDLVISARDYINVLMLAARGLARLGPGGAASGGASGGPRLIWSFHTHRASERAHMARRRDRIADWMSRQVLAGRTRWQPDALVAVSNRVASDLAADLGLPAAAFEVIENPVWTPARLEARHAPCAHPWLAGRAPMAHGHPPAHGAPRVDDPVLLAVGRLAPQKDFATLIAALTRWPGPGRPRLIILGKGPQRKALAAQIAAAGLEARVDMPGHVADVLPYMARADLFVMSSRWEGFPLALVEALGSGVPVVSTHCPGGPGDILEGGRLGGLVSPGDPEALARAMAAALDAPGDPTVRMAAAQRYSAARAAARYLALASGGDLQDIPDNVKRADLADPAAAPPETPSEIGAGAAPDPAASTLHGTGR